LESPYLKDSVIESAVGLILVETPSVANAMTVSFFSEVAHHPTALWVSVCNQAYTHSLIESARKFTLAVLNQTQKAIAIRCGTVSGRDEDKYSSLDTYRSPGGFIFLRGALASTGCTVRERVELDDHTIFIADIVESHLDSRSAHLRQLLLSDLKSE
jgi:flavin reductase (DIM6/NTAB) family NADH-FMN oxidoreductase RutF